MEKIWKIVEHKHHIIYKVIMIQRRARSPYIKNCNTEAKWNFFKIPKEKLVKIYFVSIKKPSTYN